MDRKTTTITISKLNYKPKNTGQSCHADTQNSIVSTDVVFMRNKQTFKTAFSALQQNRINDRQLIVIKQYHKKKKKKKSLASFHPMVTVAIALTYSINKFLKHHNQKHHKRVTLTLKR